MRIKFITLGCKVNQYETQALKEEFISKGCETIENGADLYIVNTCSVTLKADRKSRQIILDIKRNYPFSKIAVVGCFVKTNIEFLKKLNIDWIVLQENKHFLPEIVLNYPIKENKDIWSLRISHFSNQRAFVKIQDGCDNFCSFCKIPFIRGRSLSRKKEEVISEIKRLSIFHKEIVLCGINLGLYGKDLVPPLTLDNVIEDILNIEELYRLRLSSLEPCFLNDRIYNLFSNKKLCPHLHFPFQSGDNRILKEMNKLENVELYEEVVYRLKKINPLFAISCDIMLGFPTEDEKSFLNTVNFLERIRPMRIHIFTFSPRENTKFFETKTTNFSLIKKQYLFLKELAIKFSFEYREKFLGKTLEMIAEEEKDGYICGYTQNYIRVFLKERIELGKVLKIKITKIDKDKTFGVIL